MGASTRGAVSLKTHQRHSALVCFGLFLLLSLNQDCLFLVMLHSNFLPIMEELAKRRDANKKRETIGSLRSLFGGGPAEGGPPGGQPGGEAAGTAGAGGVGADEISLPR